MIWSPKQDLNFEKLGIFSSKTFGFLYCVSHVIKLMPTLDALVAGNKCVGKSSLIYCFISGKVLQPPFDGIFLYSQDHGLPYTKINVETQNFRLRIRECTLIRLGGYLSTLFRT